MKGRKYKPQQIVRTLRGADRLSGAGASLSKALEVSGGHDGAVAGASTAE